MGFDTGGIPRCTHQLSFHAGGEMMTPPPLSTLAKATIARTGQKLLLTGFHTCKQPPTSIDLCHQLWGVTFSRQWNLQVQLEGSQREFLNKLSDGQGYAVSNGSFKEESGAAAWLIEGPNSDLWLTGKWHTPGTSSDHSSF